MGNRIDKPWGYYLVLDDNEKYKIKKIVIYQGQRISLQYHNYRSEYWIVVDGVGLLYINSKYRAVRAGDTYDILIRDVHRVQNIWDHDLVIIEIARGIIIDEEDIIRLEDDYGRGK